MQNKTALPITRMALDRASKQNKTPPKTGKAAMGRIIVVANGLAID